MEKESEVSGVEGRKIVMRGHEKEEDKEEKDEKEGKSLTLWGKGVTRGKKVNDDVRRKQLSREKLLGCKGGKTVMWGKREKGDEEREEECSSGVNVW